MSTLEIPITEGVVKNVPSNAGTKETANGGKLGKDEFLQLLMEQMKNQDPLDPMKSTDTIAQLAQFSSLEQMTNLNTTFSGFARQDGLIQSMLLKGRSVEATKEDGTSVSGTIENVVWDSDGMTLTIGGVAYPMSSLKSLSLAEVVTAPSA